MRNLSLILTVLALAGCQVKGSSSATPAPNSAASTPTDTPEIGVQKASGPTEAHFMYCKNAEMEMAIDFGRGTLADGGLDAVVGTRTLASGGNYLTDAISSAVKATVDAGGSKTDYISITSMHPADNALVFNISTVDHKSAQLRLTDVKKSFTQEANCGLYQSNPVAGSPQWPAVASPFPPMPGTDPSKPVSPPADPPTSPVTPPIPAPQGPSDGLAATPATGLTNAHFVYCKGEKFEAGLDFRKDVLNGGVSALDADVGFRPLPDAAGGPFAITRPNSVSHSSGSSDFYDLVVIPNGTDAFVYQLETSDFHHASLTYKAWSGSFSLQATCTMYQSNPFRSTPAWP